MVSLFGNDMGGFFDAIKGATGELFASIDLGSRDPFARAQGQGSQPDPFTGINYGNSTQGFRGLGAADDPFAGLTYGGTDPFGRLDNLAGDPFGKLSGQLGGDNPAFAAFDRAKWQMDAAHQKQAAAAEAAKAKAAAPSPIGGTVTGGGGTGAKGAAGAWGNHEPYRATIEKYAAANGIDPDAVAAFLRIETSNGDPNAVNPDSGAMGLGQVMPFHFKPGENGLDPDTNLRVAIAYFATQYKTFGSYEAAAAAYLGGPGGIRNGQPRDDNPDANGTTSAGYAKLWADYFAKIKATAPQPATAPAGSGGGSGMTSIWGGVDVPVTQGYGVVTPGIDQSIYEYGREFGLGGGHTGLDIGLKRGTQLYMPAGLTGTVEIAGGSQYFGDDDVSPRGTPGKGEIRIRLSNGDILILGHTSAVNVQVGQQVNAGTLLGLSGTAGGDHLHLEVRRGGTTLVNPAEYFGYTGPPLPAGHYPGDGHNHG